MLAILDISAVVKCSAGGVIGDIGDIGDIG